MKGNKFAAMSVLTAVVLCLAGSIAQAQTPAQDSSRVEADKAAVKKAKTAVENDTLHMNADQAAKKLYALETDAAALAADKQAEIAAEDRLEADQRQMSSDNTRFNGPPEASPPPPAPQAEGRNIIGNTTIMTPAPVVAVPVPAPAPAGTAPSHY